MNTYAFTMNFLIVLMGVFAGTLLSFLTIKYVRILKSRIWCLLARKGQTPKEVKNNDTKPQKKEPPSGNHDGEEEVKLHQRIKKTAPILKESCYLDDLSYQDELHKGKQSEERAYRYIDRKRNI